MKSRASAGLCLFVAGWVLICGCATAPDGAPACGNGVLEKEEACDGDDLRRNSCWSMGFSGGTLKCSQYCLFDMSRCCDNGCDTTGRTACVDTVIRTCTMMGDGCLDWAAGTDCAAVGQTCDDSGGVALCVDGCTDRCGAQDGTRCNGTIIETCTVMGDGCLDWAAGTDCAAAEQACDDSGGVALCVDECTDQCTAQDTTRCTGTVVETCTMMGNGCLDWAAGTDCAATGQTCDMSQGVAGCVTTCIDECAQQNETRCSGDVIQTCELGGDGCRHWQNTTDCGANGQNCDDSGTNAVCVAQGCPGVMVNNTCVYLADPGDHNKADAEAVCAGLGQGWSLCSSSVVCQQSVYVYLGNSGCDCTGGSGGCNCANSNVYIHASDLAEPLYVRQPDIANCGSPACTASVLETCGAVLCCE